MGTATLTERVADPFATSTVDRGRGVIGNVLVCGTNSINNRRYPWGGGLKAAASVYEGKPVNVDHADDATVDRRIGWLKGVRFGDDGRPRADLHVLKSHPFADRIFEAAERNPGLFGLSHVARCKTRFEGGTEVVESIESVESVDLVADPATVKSLFESKGKSVGKTTLRAVLLGRLAKLSEDRQKAACRLLAEEDMGAMLDAPVDDVGGDDHDMVIDSAMEQVMTSAVRAFLTGQIDEAELGRRVKTAAKAHPKLKGTGSATASDADDSSEESRRRPDAAGLVRECIAVCQKVGWKGYDGTDLAVLEATAPADREAVARRLMAAGQPDRGEQVVSHGRHDTARLTESAEKPKDQPAGAVPTNGTDFARMIRR